MFNVKKQQQIGWEVCEEDKLQHFNALTMRGKVLGLKENWSEEAGIPVLHDY
jgi:hypothetical protein